ncbi:hypothetical protein [Alcanivorax sp. 1008]|uniref:hypothetical protein n=1 Tax=Alcanivorax sp. 1008 TaxID=2816853 RepID=UPI001D98E7D7|nr:hypothetical protein [Alcanivorax sp. 1008]MCC1496408.1 hypothetical protein [Alcanivorax sp. 1008]
MGFDTAPLLIISFCLVIVIAGSIVLLRTEWLLQWLRGTAGLLLIGLAVYFSLFSLNLFSYKQLSREEPLVTVSFRELGPQSYAATLAQPGGDNVDYQLSGDLWRVDARVIRWKGFFALLGFQSGYQLDRVQGRYLTLEDERNKDASEYQITRPAVGFDVWQNARTGWSMMLHADYASGAPMPMADGAIYEVTLGNGGLIARPLNEAAQGALKRWE